MGSITAHVVHGKGSGELTQITLQGERVCGNGRFSNVYSALLTHPENRKVAVKNAWEDKTGCFLGPRTEIEVLSKLNHPNVVSLLYHFTRNVDNQKVYCLVLDFLPDDMYKLRTKGVKFDLLDAKLYSYQLFSGVAHLAKHSVVHLDIKPANIIIDHERGILKLADFGNAQFLDTSFKQATSYQVTRYYRPPELLFGTTSFTSAIDVWSAACVMYEFVANHSLFKGSSTLDQIRMIVDVFGYPTEKEVKSMKSNRPRTSRKKARGLDLFTQHQLDSDCMSLLKKIFVYSPNERMTAEECLTHAFFDVLKQSPAPVRSNGQPVPLSHENSTEKQEENETSSSEDSD